jgi:hypothetical protein
MSNFKMHSSSSLEFTSLSRQTLLPLVKESLRVCHSPLTDTLASHIGNENWQLAFPILKNPSIQPKLSAPQRLLLAQAIAYCELRCSEKAAAKKAASWLFWRQPFSQHKADKKLGAAFTLAYYILCLKIPSGRGVIDYAALEEGRLATFFNECKRVMPECHSDFNRASAIQKLRSTSTPFIEILWRS